MQQGLDSCRLRRARGSIPKTVMECGLARELLAASVAPGHSGRKATGPEVTILCRQQISTPPCADSSRLVAGYLPPGRYLISYITQTDQLLAPHQLVEIEFGASEILNLLQFSFLGRKWKFTLERGFLFDTSEASNPDFQAACERSTNIPTVLASSR